MAKKSSRHASEQKRAGRRRRDRERAREATEALLTTEGWQRWLRARAVFHSYSLQNTLLLAHQCAERGITPRRVGGFRAWLKLGRCVRKGESALWVMAPMAIKRREGEAEEPDDEKRVFFRSVPVFELSQTEPLPGVEPEPLEPPSVPIDGDSHQHVLGPLSGLAAEIGYGMSYAELDGACGGFCDYRAKQIVIEQRLAPNAKVRVAVHELATPSVSPATASGTTAPRSSLSAPPSSSAPDSDCRPAANRCLTWPAGARTAPSMRSPKRPK